MDLDTLVTRYDGEALLQRLLWIATTCGGGGVAVTSTNNTTTSTAIADGGVVTSPTATTTSHALLSQQQQQQQAYKMAASQMRASGNTHRYKEVFGNHNQNNNTLNQIVPFDGHWVQQQEMSNRQSRDVLVSRLNTAQSHLHKDAIRAAYLALSDHDLKIGNLNDAFASTLRAKDCCTTRQQTALVSLKIIELSLYVHNYAGVRDYCTKLEHTVGSSSGGGDASSSSNHNFDHVKYKVSIASALDHLYRGEYDLAAKKFLQVATAQHQGGTSGGSGGGGEQQQSSSSASPGAGATKSSSGGASSNTSNSSGGGWSTVLAGEEIGLYASFLALAMLSREQMISLAQHPEALELVPSMRETLIEFALRSNYKQCWNVMAGTVFEILEQDLYMSPHLSILKDKIRQKTLLFAWQPYQRVSFTDFANELGSGLVPSTDMLVQQFVDLIGNQSSKAELAGTRIDMPSQYLVREIPDPELTRLQATSMKLSNMTSTVLDDTYGMVIRLACIENNLIVGDGGGGGGRGQRGGGRGHHGGGSSKRGRAMMPGGIARNRSRDDGGGGGTHNIMDFGSGINAGFAAAFGGGGGIGGTPVVQMSGGDSSGIDDDDQVGMDDGDDDDDDSDGINDAAVYDDDDDGIDEVQVEGDDNNMGDADMIDADMNPEDMY